ncbi:unnamed protein product [Euphydryas editha]|uniref:DUF4817 domain-containing protein n=1 Tax=Euphydryas editha TaxID=104508 RepID=A0AAU9TUF7_EUPED|nr:unnamed protein product [Euphydryas editha]
MVIDIHLISSHLCALLCIAVIKNSLSFSFTLNKTLCSFFDTIAGRNVPRSSFTNEEYADILFICGKVNGNALEARRLYREKYRIRRLPDENVFSRTYRRIRETGTVRRQRQEPGVNQPGEEDELVLEAFQQDPATSIRVVAAILNLSIWRGFSVNVWAGVIGGLFIGPFILPNILIGENYLSFLQNELRVLLKNVPLDVRREMIFQNDGCPAHYRRTVREHLSPFHNRWIGRNGPILWPARSPDLTPIDFYVWGRMKEIIYEVEIVDLEHLTARINQAAEVLRREMRLGITTTEIINRARKCIQNGG